VANLKQRLAGLTPAERQLLAQKLKRARHVPTTDDSSGISGASGPVSTVLHAFAGWVQRAPEAVAIADRERALSYAGLDRVADRLADRLVQAGAGPETPVAFCLERSLESVVAMLATLKAGAAYVPIDRDNPPRRIEFMLRDTGARVLLVQDPRDVQALAYDGEIISVIAALEGPRYDTRRLSDIRATAQSLACVMYTSGSTGEPKGVCIEHRGISRLVCDPDYISLGPADRIAHASNPAFDATTFEVWGALANGARLEILATEDLLSPPTLRRQIDSRQLTVLFLTTALFNDLAAADPTLFATLRCLLFGGEAASLSALRLVVAQGKPARLINAYGPTENTTFTTCYEAGEEMLAPDCDTVPIGRAIRGTYVRVLDDELQPVSPGQAGELYAGGAGLARGYLGRPEQTATVFLRDPMDRTGEQRLYRTGDRVRLRQDGNIEFLGRMDEQLKLRGFRIEPVEIRRALEQNPLVRAAVVFAQGEEGAPKTLVACIEPAQEAASDCESLRAELGTRLPAYMVPQRWLLVDEWPLSANGKIDRGALARLVDAQGRGGSSKATPVEPRTVTERRLVPIVRDLIQHGAVSVTDDFFAIGGHSLLATRLVLRAERECGVSLTVSEVFDYPVLRDLAARIDRLRDEAGEPACPTGADAGDRLPMYPLSSMQQRLWFLEQLEPGSSTYHMHLALRLRGALDSRLLESALDLVVARHETLRTCFGLHGAEYCQQVNTGRKARLPMVELPMASGADVDRALQERFDALFEPAFDLYRGPLYRAELIRVATNDHVLSLVMHHIISDGWSMNVLREELAEAYRAFAHRERPQLAELPMQYGDYANSCSEIEETPEHRRQLAYWMHALRGLPVLDLPTDSPRPPRRDSAGAACTHAIDADFASRLRAFCKDRGVTLFMLLMAVYQLLLARLSNQTDIAVGIPIAGRNRVELERLIGFFVNTLVIRGDLSGNPAFDEHLGRVRETALEAYANSSVAFDRLVDVLRPRRDLGRNPLYDAMLNLVHETQESPFGDLRATALRRTSAVAKVDLELYVREQVSGTGIELQLVYRSALFSGARMRAFLSQFVSLLEQVLARPRSRIDDYSLAVGSRAGVLPDPRAPIVEAPIPSVLSRFLQVAAAKPELTAIEAGFQVVSFGELAANARKGAAWLHSVGVRGAEVIAVGGESTPGLVTALLATLLAGCVILPIDTGLPPIRKRLMLRQAGAARLLLVGDCEDFRAGDESPHLLPCHRLDSYTGLPEDTDASSAHAFAAFEFREPDANAPAYVFFTSGSTGVPKAVLGCHKGLNHFIDWQIAEFGITSADRVAQLTSLSFDVVLRDLFLPLAAGAAICLPDSEAAVLPLRWLEDARVTVLHVVPTRANSWLADRPSAIGLKTLRWIFFAGEPLSRDLVGKWRSAFPQSGEIVNLYGPTETTLVKSWYRVPEQIPDAVVSVGNPLPGAQILILRDHRHLCGIGERGEIFIRTPYRTLGYCNAEAETRARFVRNPFTEDALDVVYMTGDRGMYRPDGTIQMLGRLDEQVKIRGVRVEPAEVAAALGSLAPVANAHVAASEDAAGETMLVAYVMPRHGAPANARELRVLLAQRLPAAMVPAAFVFLDELPRLPTGKIDRSRLPPHGPPRDLGTNELPRTETERQLSDIWSSLLNAKQIGLHDDFFTLGGHSLMANRLMNRVEHLFGLRLPLASVFEHPTLAGMALHLDLQRVRGSGPEEHFEPGTEVDEL